MKSAQFEVWVLGTFCGFQVREQSCKPNVLYHCVFKTKGSDKYAEFHYTKLIALTVCFLVGPWKTNGSTSITHTRRMKTFTVAPYVNQPSMLPSFSYYGLYLSMLAVSTQISLQVSLVVLIYWKRNKKWKIDCYFISRSAMILYFVAHVMVNFPDWDFVYLRRVSN